MMRPPWEVADVIRRIGGKFLECYGESLTWAQVKVLAAIVRCRTAALGGHRDQCLRCGYQAISYNSCRNRHCPKCQTNAREKWLRQRQQELLPVGYFHLVFSTPHALVPLIWQNKKVLFTLLFEATAPCSKWLPIPNISVRSSDFSASCTPGDRPCNRTPTFTASCQEEGCRPTTSAGVLAVLTSSCR